ncbi:hypothetical protein HYX08_04045 [Candidatus Woesearchaeota archaeon]|nr:hypothetical protein [Candidatus Woesearchaeota archaeon]
MPELEQKTFQRQVAYKIRISDILDSSLKKDETSAGYIILNGMNVSRVNIIATVVYISEDSGFRSTLIDDGTGRISLRAFDNSNLFSALEIGDVVLMVGKIREFSNDKYIMPEILKKLGDTGWLGLRKAELDRLPDIKGESQKPDEAVNTGEHIYSLIRSLDIGDGVPIEDIIKKSNDSMAEKIISRLLESGDIFEVRPGMLKVLE